MQARTFDQVFGHNPQSNLDLELSCISIDAGGHSESHGVHDSPVARLYLQLSWNNHHDMDNRHQVFDHNLRLSPNQELPCIQIDFADHFEATGVHKSSADHPQLE